MKGNKITRRRLLSITATSPLIGLASPVRSKSPVTKWRGSALGAQAQIILSGVDDADAASIFMGVRDEISRLESIFNIYNIRSQISHLNLTGELKAPALDLLEVLSLCMTVHRASGGAFDPAVQTLWQAHREGLGEDARMTGSFGDLRIETDKILLTRPGMALTLNGVAQGYVTDRVAAYLRSQGLRDVVVDTGEVYAMGERPSGGPWNAGIAGPDNRVLDRVWLSDRAIATSSPMATTLGENGHIFDPSSGRTAAAASTVSVVHDSAAVADALSTAACCLSVGQTEDMLGFFPGARVAYRA